MLLVTARFVCPPDAAEEFAAAAREVTARTRSQEPGCLDYTCCRSLADDDVFVFVEQWQDGAALNAHAQSTHFQQFDAAAKNLVKDRTIEVHVVERTKSL
jgi:quinol monooxygenase YgiN